MWPKMRQPVLAKYAWKYMVRIAEHVYLLSSIPLTGDQILIDRVSGASNLTLFLEHEVLTMAKMFLRSKSLSLPARVQKLPFKPIATFKG